MDVADVCLSPNLLDAELTKEEECPITGVGREGHYGLAADGDVADAVTPNVKLLPIDATQCGVPACSCVRIQGVRQSITGVCVQNAFIA